ncbi:MAG: hypothetical protein AB7I59_19505 [Geminicoccaceae bacterium]
MTAEKTPAADRHHGGPGSSHQRPDLPDPTADRGPGPGQPTNPDRSQVSGGGGEQDRHHTHDPRRKGG